MKYASIRQSAHRVLASILSMKRGGAHFVRIILPIVPFAAVLVTVHHASITILPIMGSVSNAYLLSPTALHVLESINPLYVVAAQTVIISPTPGNVSAAPPISPTAPPAQTNPSAPHATQAISLIQLAVLLVSATVPHAKTQLLVINVSMGTIWPILPLAPNVHRTASTVRIQLIVSYAILGIMSMRPRNV